MKKLAFLTFIMLLVLTVMLTACSTTQQQTSSSQSQSSSQTTSSDTQQATETVKKARTIGCVLIMGNNPHCQEFEKGVRSIVEANGDKLVVLDAQFDKEKEVKCMEDLITQKVDGIVLEVTGTDSVVGALESAKKAGILVASADQQVGKPELVVSQTVSDNELAGKLCAQDLVKKMGATGEVIVINAPGQAAAEAREKGFVDELKKYPGIKIVATGVGDGVIDKAAAQTESLMQAHPGAKAVFGTNDPNAIGALSAYESAGKLSDVLIYGVDGSPDAVNFVAEGKMAGTVRQRPFDLGKFAAEDLYKALNGENIDQIFKLVEVFLINSDNAKDYIVK